MNRCVVLLRGINVGGRTLPMAALRTTMRDGGFPDCDTYIASGNLVLAGGAGGMAEVEARTEQLIAAAFGLRVQAIARSGEALAALAAANPFPEAVPRLLHLGLAKQPLRDDAAEALAPRIGAGERIAVAGGGLWIDFAGGVADSRLTAPALDKAAGSTLTSRNWNTVRKLVEMAGG